MFFSFSGGLVSAAVGGVSQVASLLGGCLVVRWCGGANGGGGGRSRPHISTLNLKFCE